MASAMILAFTRKRIGSLVCMWNVCIVFCMLVSCFLPALQPTAGLNLPTTMFAYIVPEKREEEFWEPDPHPKRALSLTHDLLRVLSMDTWWNFSHKLRKKLEEEFQSFLPHSQPATAGTQLGKITVFQKRRFTPRMCIQNDQRNVGITLRYVCRGTGTPPPPSTCLPDLLCKSSPLPLCAVPFARRQCRKLHHC